MAVVNLTLYVNVTKGLLQASSTNGTRVDSPTFTVGDTYSVKVMLLEQQGDGPASVFTVITPTSLGLKVGIGPLGGTPDVLQTSWTASGSFLTGTLDCSTSDFNTAVNASETLHFEIEASESGQYSTVYQVQATYRKQVVPTSATTPTPAESFRTKADSDNTYVKKVGLAGESITLTSADGTRRVVLWVDNDGGFHADTAT